MDVRGKGILLVYDIIEVSVLGYRVEWRREYERDKERIFSIEGWEILRRDCKDLIYI